MIRRAAKVDANHGAIVRALIAHRYAVASLAGCGDGLPDLMVCGPVHPFPLFLLEVKDGSKPPSKRTLTPAQVKFHREWPGTIHVVHSIEQALAAVGVVRESA
jgi:hypothetical protein